MNIVPISCSENPCSSFDFTYEAKSVEEYKNYIINYNKLKPRNRSQVGEFYYMHYINKKSEYPIDNVNINGIHINEINRFDTKTSDLLKIKNF